MGLNISEQETSVSFHETVIFAVFTRLILQL